nr:uncharacterized protein LOC128688894 [Cherax quadricarinatus]XP_053632897.1 uncharacterized protein LOC128688894 [Cherax quadricarinatus]XP_053632898.1 uncharacterized protein LOC128688894 [Cherax quadricarinatus]XP_053632899.1 uncharacterized protein LOC128688894 [Cherax quadricarinatus]
MSSVVMNGWQLVGGQSVDSGGGCDNSGGVSGEVGMGDQDGEPPSLTQDCLPSYTQDESGEHQALLNPSVSDGSTELPCQHQGQGAVPLNISSQSECHIRIFTPNESSAETYDSEECGVVCGDGHSEKVSSCEQSSLSSRESTCGTNPTSPAEDDASSVWKKSFVDSSTQTGPACDACSYILAAGKMTSVIESGSGDGYEYHALKKLYCTNKRSDENLKASGVVFSSQVTQTEQTSSRLDIGRPTSSKLSLAERRQKVCISDYSPLPLCDSSRGSDSGNSLGGGSSSSSTSTSNSCSSSSGTNCHFHKSGETGFKKVSACSELSPIASCGGDSTSNAGLAVSVGLSSDPSIKDIGGRSPCTPTSGCLKAGTRVPTGAHVQFDTPYEDDDTRVLHDTLVTEDGHITLHKPCGGSVTPTHGDQLSRLWSKLVPDSSPSEIASNLQVPKKWRRRQVSGSSSISLGSSSSDSTNSQGTEFERQAPDGGWGWVIVAASFMVHCIADGITMSFGVIFVELLSYFQESRSLTSWVGSLFMAIPLLAGPLASLLTDRYGCRTVTICGALVACFGFFVGAFVNTIPLLLLTVGIITGLGLAVCYVAAIVIVAFYFEKKRSLATGIAVAGSGIGTFLFAPLIQYLVDYWGWRLCFIMLAGIFLNMVVCGALMRDLEWTPRDSSSLRDANTTTVSSRRGSTSQSSETVGGRGGSVGTGLPSLEELRRLVQSGDVTALLSPDDTPSGTLRGSASLVLLPTFLSRSQALPPDVIPCLSSRTNAYEVVSHMYPHLLSHSLSGHVDQVHTQLEKKHLPKTQKEKMSTYALTPVTSCGSAAVNNQDKVEDVPLQHPSRSGPSYSDTDSTTPGSVLTSIPIQTGSGKKIDLKIEFNTPDDGDEADNEEENEDPKEMKAMLESVRWRGGGGRNNAGRRISTGCMGTSSSPPHAAPLHNMRINRQSMTYRGAMLNIHRYRLRASSCPDIYRNSIITIAKSQDERAWTYLDDVGELITSCVDVSYCMEASYLIFAISNFVLYVFYDTVYMYLTDYALGVGVSADDSANLISVIGILNCLGTVLMGYVGDRTWSSPVILYNVSMVICGLSIISMPFITNYWLLAMTSGVFGLFISANYALTSVILVELVSLEAFSKTYGMLLLIQGVANLIGPPLVGYVADTTGDYVMPFVMSGLFIVACGLILNAIPLIQRYKHKCPSSTSSPVDTPKNGSPTVISVYNLKKKSEPSQL